MVRTTLSIDQDLYDIALAIARDRRQSLSAVINELLRNGLTATSEEPLRVSKRGFPSFRTRRRVTMDDVRSLEDEI
ncbi:MAG: antitoxin [Verrucomicrobia bacterium]|nr:antitoxin [Verrucomicrobiota bacterium]